MAEPPVGGFHCCSGRRDPPSGHRPKQSGLADGCCHCPGECPQVRANIHRNLAGPQEHRQQTSLVWFIRVIIVQKHRLMIDTL